MNKLILRILIVVAVASIPFYKVSAFSGPGAGTFGDPYIIANCVQLQEMNDDLAASYKLANSMDCADTSNWNGFQGFGPIGDNVTPFTGNFNGDGYTVSNLYMNRPSNYQGLFGYTNGATITKIKLTGSIQGDSYVGGLVGYANATTITLSVSSVSVSGTVAGGLVGGLAGSAIQNSYSHGSVTGAGQIGGLVGDAISSTITHSYSKGAVSSIGIVGGLIGTDSGSNTFDDLYWDTETSGTSTGCNINGLGTCAGLTGKTTLQMQDQETYNPSNSYGFTLSNYAAYRYVKWEITRIKYGPDTNCYTGDVCTQVSEFDFTIGGFPISTSGVTVTNPDGINPPGADASNLVDDNTGTKFLDAAYSYSNNSDGLTTVIFDAGSGNLLTFNGYNWATGNDQNYRDPVSWTVSGSNNGTDYTVLDVQSNFATTEDRNTFVSSQNTEWDFYTTWGIWSEVNNGYPFLQWEGYAYDYNAPTIITRSPERYETGTAIDVPIVLTFSKPMNPDSLVVSTGPCEEECATYTVTWSENNRILTLVRVNNGGFFEPNTQYTVTVEADDSEGDPLVGGSDGTIFTTYVPLVLTQVTPIPSQIFTRTATYYFDANGSNPLEEQYVFEVCGPGHVDDGAIVTVDTINHTVTFTNLVVGHTYYCGFMLESLHRGTSDILYIGPFTVNNPPIAILLDSLPQTVSQVTVATPTSISTPITPEKKSFTFERNLRMGMIDPDVAKLQAYLHDAGFPVSPAGQPGSKGFETNKFGGATKAALIKFQKAKGIKPASGFLGPLTRAYINSH